MKIEKHHIHLLPIVAVAVIGTFLAFTSWMNILAQTTSSGGDSSSIYTTTTTTAPIACAYNCSNWSSCGSNSTMTRSCSKSPSSCFDATEPPKTSQPCTYVAPVTYPICAYTYTDWSACSSSGTQTRSIASKTPSNCVGGTVDNLSRSCTPTTTTTTTTNTTTNTAPICSFTYSEWSACSSSGMQTRLIISRYPDNCMGGIYETSRSCTYASTSTSSSGGSTTTTTTSTLNCTKNCSVWSSCNSDGTRSRSCSVPSGCGTVQAWTEKESCTYTNTSGSTSTTSGSGNSTVITTPTTLNCTSSCSSWSSCGTDGFQARTCTAPSGCPSTSWMEKNPCTSNTGSSSGGTTSTSTATTSTTSTAYINCAYQCSPWSACYPAGYQDRMCQKPSGTSCVANQEKQPCTYSGPTTTANSTTTQTTCTQLCSSWSVCSPAGIKAQNCWPSPSGCPGETKTVTQSCAPIVCKFTYSEWGTCTDGFQFRTIASSGPAGCVGGEPVLSQSCTAEASENTTTSENTATQTTAVASPTGPTDPDLSVNDDWKKETFKTTACSNQVCGGDVDPDKDGLSNNDEFRYGTNPLNPDTDNDGKKDGEEIAAGTDPLKSSAKGEEDKITFESPKDAGTVRSEIYQVTNVEMVEASEGNTKQMKLTGKGPANSYINVYIYSGEPVIVTVKTDSNGDWTYVVDKELDDGNHEVYVAVTNNSGAIKAKSEPLPFVKTAQAVNVANAESSAVEQPKEKAGISIRSLLFIFALAFFGVVVAIVVLGAVIKKIASKISLS
jgi:hypothetical protein